MRQAAEPGEHFPPGRELSGTPAEAEMESEVEGRTASALFAGFRALGLFSNDVPHVVRYNALKRRFYVTTCVGKSFHTYDVSDFLHPLPRNQNCPGVVPFSPPTLLGFPFLPPCLTSPLPVGAVLMASLCPCYLFTWGRVSEESSGPGDSPW